MMMMIMDNYMFRPLLAILRLPQENLRSYYTLLYACTCTYTCMHIVRSEVPLRQPEDGQYRPKHVVVHYIVIKCTSCDTVVFDYTQFSDCKGRER